MDDLVRKELGLTREAVVEPEESPEKDKPAPSRR
jgi:hypothetical protein